MRLENPMTVWDRGRAAWRKSSHSSGGTQGECVEVAVLRTSAGSE